MAIQGIAEVRVGDPSHKVADFTSGQDALLSKCARYLDRTASNVTNSARRAFRVAPTVVPRSVANWFNGLQIVKTVKDIAPELAPHEVRDVLDFLRTQAKGKIASTQRQLWNSNRTGRFVGDDHVHGVVTRLKGTMDRAAVRLLPLEESIVQIFDKYPHLREPLGALINKVIQQFNRDVAPQYAYSVR